MKIKITINEDKEFKPHKMYDPKNMDKNYKGVDTKTKEDHDKYEKKGYIHIDPKKIRKIIGPDEDGAAGMAAFEKALPDFSKKEIEDA